MTYDQLIILDKIVKCGSFKSAAESLNRTQPSISIAIKKLEEEFGITIFSREDYRPKLTSLGKAFYQKSLAAISSFNELNNFGKELSKGAEAELNIYIDAICPISLISNSFKNFECSINLYIDVLEGLLEKVILKKADFAIGPFFENTDNIYGQKIFTIKMTPVISSELYNIHANSYQQICKFPQIIVRSSYEKFEENIVGSAPEMKKSFTSDISAKKQLILSGIGWGRLPYYMIENEIKEGKLKIITEIDQINTILVPMYLVRNKNHVFGPNAKQLWNNILKLENK